MHFPNPRRCFQYLPHHITSIYSIKNLFPFPYSFTFVTSGNWQVLPSPSTPSMVGHSSILVAVLPCSARSGEQKKKKKNCRETEGRGGRRRGHIHTWETPFLVPVKKLQHPRGSSSFQVTLQIWFGISSNLENIGISFGNLVWCSSDLGFILLFFFSNQTCVFFSLTETGLGFNNLGILLLFFGFVFLRCFLLCGGPICIEKILDLQRSSELHQRSFFILNLEVILGFL